MKANFSVHLLAVLVLVLVFAGHSARAQNTKRCRLRIYRIMPKEEEDQAMNLQKYMRKYLAAENKHHIRVVCLAYFPDTDPEFHVQYEIVNGTSTEIRVVRLLQDDTGAFYIKRDEKI